MTCDKEKKNDIGDGGVAFPNPLDGDGYPPLKYGYGGMSLRDYFAAKAMQGMLTNPDTMREACHVVGCNQGVTQEDVVAHWAGAQADAMLKEKECK